MLFKILGYCMLVACTTGFGILAGQRLQKRVKELDTFIVVIKNLTYELNFNLSTPPQMITAVASNNRFSGFEPLQLCSRFCKQGELFHTAWEQSVERGSLYLNKEDKRLIGSLSSIIGSSDLSAQNDSLEFFLHTLTDRVTEARDYCKSHYKLYNTLGVLSGVFVILLLL